MSLPNELLGVIFEYGHLSSLRTRPPNEVVLSHVNQRFRDVAMNTRLLWTRIEVFVRTPFSKVIAYLQRSRTYPFDLFLDMDTDADWQLQPDSYLYTSPEWETIIHYMARCRTFSLRSNNSDVVDDIITFLQPVYAPVLRSLTIEYDNFGLDPELHRNIIEGGAPALTAVRMEGLGLYQCRPPLTRVTSLILPRLTWRITWSGLRDILRGSPALTCLAIGDIFAEDIPINFESSIILPSLRSLRINEQYYGRPPLQILIAISAPLLETLTINIGLKHDLVNVCQLQNSHRFPCLRYLNVSLPRGEYISEALWALFCGVFPRTVSFGLRLDVHHVHGTAAASSLITTLGFIPAHRASSPLPPPLPELHTLSFSHLSMGTYGLLCDLVSKRQAAGRPLKLLQVPAIVLHHVDFAGSMSHLRALIEVEEYRVDDGLVVGT